MGFADLVEDISEKVEAPVTRHPRHAQSVLQGLGNVGLVASGWLTGNYGRMATGIFGAGRDFSYPFMRHFMESGRADTALSVAGLLTNIPQLYKSASVPETVAVGLVMAGWGLKALTKPSAQAIPRLRDNATSKTTERLMNVFERSAATIFGTVPASLFSVRGVMELMDGITKHDYSIEAAGLCFIFGGVACYFAGQKHIASMFTPPAVARENVVRQRDFSATMD